MRAFIHVAVILSKLSLSLRKCKAERPAAHTVYSVYIKSPLKRSPTLARALLTVSGCERAAALVIYGSSWAQGLLGLRQGQLDGETTAATTSSPWAPASKLASPLCCLHLGGPWRTHSTQD